MSAYCRECGRRLAIGEGHTGFISNSWKGGLLCNKCYKSQKSTIAGFLLLVVGCIAGGIPGMYTISRLGWAVDKWGFAGARNLVVGIGVAGFFLWFVCRTMKTQVKGCVFRLLLIFIGFVALWFGICLEFCAFIDDAKLLKDSWGIQKNAPIEESFQGQRHD